MFCVIIFGFLASICFIRNGIESQPTVEDDVCEVWRLKQAEEDNEMLRMSFKEASLSLERAEQELKKPCEHRPVVINLIVRFDQSSSPGWPSYHVRGVTKHDDRICILFYHTKSFLVFEDRNPFRLLGEIHLTQLGWSCDIVYNDRSKRFYVTDSLSNCIWKITITNGNQTQVRKWLESASNPHTMSLSSDGHLLVLKDGQYQNSAHSYLDIFNGSDDRLIRRLQLPSGIREPEHAIQTRTGEYLISHKMGDKYNGTWVISRVTSDGQRIIIQSNPRNGSEKLNWRCHLSLDADNNQLFVADYMNNRVILFDSVSLEFRQILLTNEADRIQWPERIYFDKFKKQLIVGHYYNDRGVVDVYEIN